MTSLRIIRWLHISFLTTKLTPVTLKVERNDCNIQTDPWLTRPIVRLVIIAFKFNLCFTKCLRFKKKPGKSLEWLPPSKVLDLVHLVIITIHFERKPTAQKFLPTNFDNFLLRHCIDILAHIYIYVHPNLQNMYIVQLWVPIKMINNQLSKHAVSEIKLYI